MAGVSERIDESIAHDMAQLETQARDMAIVASTAPASAMLDSTRPRNVLKVVGHFRLVTAATSWR